MHKPPRADFLPCLILADTANDYFFCEYSVFFKNEFFFWMNIVDLKKKGIFDYNDCNAKSDDGVFFLLCRCGAINFDIPLFADRMKSEVLK